MQVKRANPYAGDAAAPVAAAAPPAEPSAPLSIPGPSADESKGRLPPRGQTRVTFNADEDEYREFKKVCLDRRVNVGELFRQYIHEVVAGAR